MGDLHRIVPPADGNRISEEEVHDVFISRVRSLPFLAAACAFTAAALLCIITIPQLFSLQADERVLRQLYMSGVTDPSAVRTWLMIYKAVIVLCLVLSSSTAVGLWMTFSGAVSGKLAERTGAGMNIISAVHICLQYSLYALCALAVPLFLYKACAYVVECLSENLVAFLLFAMVLLEGVMAAVFVLLVRFLLYHIKAICDTAASIAYTAALLKVEAQGVPASVIRTLNWMGILCGFIAFLMYPNVCQMLAFLFAAAGQIAAGSAIKRYRSQAAMMLYLRARETQGDAVRAHLAVGRGEKL